MIQFNLPSFTLPSLLDIAEAFSDWNGTCLLYSGGRLDSAETSFLALFPFETVTLFGHRLIYQAGDVRQEFEVEDPWEGLQQHFFNKLPDDNSSMAFGWLGYGMGASADKERKLPYRPSTLPDAYWQRCAVVLRFDHKLKQASVTVDLSAKESVDGKSARWIEILASAGGWEEFLRNLCCTPQTYQAPPFPLPFSDCPERRTTYLEKVSAIQELIREGEVYQVNLSQQFEFRGKRDPFSLYREICNTNPAPFSAYFRLGKTSLVSSSPERFLCKKGQKLETRPIKGTIKRGSTEEEDLRLKESLLASPKERAELLMITDLMRNDLGKISESGSVRTLELWRCEAYTNVFHLISIIQSIAKKGLKPLEIVRDCFPGGSVTGCPKLRAMEVIDELENRPRGIYTGSIGYFTGTGNFDLNIAIRTLVAEGEAFSLQLGGGIVIDSNPESEYLETIYKGASFFNLIQRDIVCDSKIT